MEVLKKAIAAILAAVITRHLTKKRLEISTTGSIKKPTA